MSQAEDRAACPQYWSVLLFFFFYGLILPQPLFGESKNTAAFEAHGSGAYFENVSKAAASSQAAAPTIKGCIKNLPDGLDTVRIAFVLKGQLRVKQQIHVHRGCFELEWPNPERGIFILYLDQDHSIDFLLTDAPVEFEGNYEKWDRIAVKGAGQEEFRNFKTQYTALQKDISAGKAPSNAAQQMVQGLSDPNLKAFLMPQWLPMTPDTNVAWLRSHFWDHTDLESPSTLINPFFEGNRNLYFEQVLGHEPDTIIYHLERLFKRPMDPKIKRVLVSYATYHYEGSAYLGEDEVFVWLVKNFYKTGYADWVKGNDLSDIIEKADGLATEILGKTAPDFAFNTRDSLRVKLSEVESPITLLWFWDSTCGHCKRQTPKLKAVYDEYKDRGVQVVAITLENEFTSWNRYIDQHNLDWINGFEADFDRPNFLWFYYIPSTPKLLVLDKDKRIIAKRLDIETTLRTFLDDHLVEE